MSVTYILPILVSLTGLFLLFKLRFFFLIHPKRTLLLFAGTLKEKENRASLCLALAGTLGVGNIFGVAAGIMIGGAGSVFWLTVAGIFSMVIKYAEALLATDSLTEKNGGMHLVIKKTLKRSGGFLSCLYCALCITLSLLMGSAIQSRAACDVTGEAFGISPVWFSLLFTVLIFVSVIGGGDKIEKITEMVIPLTTIIYIILAFLVIAFNFSRFFDSVLLIFKSAFSYKAATGGVLGFIIGGGIKEGFCRGILSNEAGVGTSAMAHARAKKRAPAEAGLYGICEVFFDTLLLCPLTAFMILCSVSDTERFSTPMSLVSHSVESTLGTPCLFILTLCILSFAYSTVSCWFYYGTECCTYLFPRCTGFLFAPLFFAFIFIGSSLNDSLLLSATDVIILLMSFITLFLIVKESERIRNITERSGLM